jgi:hypothetical protein
MACMAMDGVPRKYHAAVLGDGQVMPIMETLGRRLLREIDPLSREGRALLGSGCVDLWHDDGARHETIAIGDLLDRKAAQARARRGEHPELPGWTEHHDRLLRRITRMKRVLTSRP